MEVAKHAGLPAGCHWVSLNDASALEREGILMKHCVRSYADKVGDGSAQVYSLRDGDDLSLATLELSPHRSPQQLLDMWPCSAVARRERQRELDAGYRVLAFIQLRGRLNQDVSSAVIDAFLQLQSHLRSRGYVIWRGEEFDNCRLTGIVKDRGILEPVASFPAGAFIESMAWDGASDAVIPEGLRFATLEIYNARDTSRWPASLDARRIRLHKEIHYLDARSWQVEEVILDSDLLVPSCADGELFLGRLEKLIFDEKSVFTGAPRTLGGSQTRRLHRPPGKYLSRLCAQARKVFLPWFRADSIELRDTEHLYAPRRGCGRSARVHGTERALPQPRFRLAEKNLAILGSAARSGHFSACSIQVGCNRSEHEGFRGLSGHAPSPADDRSTSLELAIALEELDLQRSGQPGEWISRLTEAQPDKTRLLGDWSFIRRLADFADRSSVRQVSFFAAREAETAARRVQGGKRHLAEPGVAVGDHGGRPGLGWQKGRIDPRRPHGLDQGGDIGLESGREGRLFPSGHRPATGSLSSTPETTRMRRYPATCRRAAIEPTAMPSNAPSRASTRGAAKRPGASGWTSVRRAGCPATTPFSRPSMMSAGSARSCSGRTTKRRSNACCRKPLPRWKACEHCRPKYRMR
ncbi:hypothetical protein ACFS3C_13450 [Azotobacter vinelandii]